LKHAFPKNSPMSQDSEPGMTLLDWFAGMALSGMGVDWSECSVDFAGRAYEVALEMMKVRDDAHRKLRQYACGEEEQVVGDGVINEEEAGEEKAGEEETGEEKAGEEKAGEET